MELTKRRQRYRAILEGTECVHPASIFDPISARVAEDLGFEIGMLAGSTASMTVLGAPDRNVLTLTEFSEQIHRICRASSISLMVDADHGYGNALSVMRTVEELETSGVAALSIEDTLLPAGFGSSGESQMVSLEEGVGKMKAALAARQDPSLTIIGRTSALAMSGIPEAIRRAKAYERAGVDAIFLAGGRTREEVAAVHSEIGVPLILGRVNKETSDKKFLAAHGVRVALQGHFAFPAAVKAVHDTLKKLRDGAQPSDLAPSIASADLMAKVTRSASYDRWAHDMLGVKS